MAESNNTESDALGETFQPTKFTLRGKGATTLVYLTLNRQPILANLAEAAEAMGYAKTAANGAVRDQLVTDRKARSCSAHRRTLLLDHVRSKVLKITRENKAIAEAVLDLFDARLGEPSDFDYERELKIAQRKIRFAYRGECEAKSKTLNRELASVSPPLDFIEGHAATIKGSPTVELWHMPKHASAELIDRVAEADLLHYSWRRAIQHEHGRPHILTFVAPGGEGKTSVVTKWIGEMAAQVWPHCEKFFAWSFYKQGMQGRHQADSDLFLRRALEFFGDADSAQSSIDPEERGRKLAQVVGEQQAVLILDGLETLQFPITSVHRGSLRDLGITGLLTGLAALSKGLCVVTTRTSVPDLACFRHTTSPELDLPPLSVKDGATLLSARGVKGAHEDLEALATKVKGHALTLQLMGTYLHAAHDGDVRRHDLVQLEQADEEQGGHAFRVMQSYADWFATDGVRGNRALALLRMIGLFDRPATIDCLKSLRKPPAIPGLSEALVGCTSKEWNITVTRLEEARLITTARDQHGAIDAIDAHPIIREFFAKDVLLSNPAGWEAAHTRLFTHLQASAPEYPASIEKLQPLYQAIVHGCLAGKHVGALNEVFRGRILRNNEFFSTYQLGAYASDLGAVACFFDEPWDTLAPTLPVEEQAWLLNQAAFCLRPLGRLGEARTAMRRASELRADSEQWIPAAVSAGQLCETELALGDHKSAVRSGILAVRFADASGDTYARMTRRMTCGDALHNAGHFEEAATIFSDAETMERERPDTCPALRSLSRFVHADFLLRQCEVETWRVILGRSSHKALSHSSVFSLIREQVAATLPLAMEACWLVNIAVDHLSLARVALYEAILHGAPLEPCVEQADRAVVSLRRTRVQDYLVRGLLTRALLLSQIGTSEGSESARADLDEAHHLCNRGPMAALMADVHLHRCRLFRAHSPYPFETTPQQDLMAARTLIEQTGYGRRIEELLDAESALGEPSPR